MPRLRFSSSACSFVSPASSRRAITVPTGTLSPGPIASSQTVPGSQISTSIAVLLVSTTATTSPFFTSSPGLTFHSISVPSSISAPSDGSLNSIIAWTLRSSLAEGSRSALAEQLLRAATTFAGCGSAASSRCFA